MVLFKLYNNKSFSPYLQDIEVIKQKKKTMTKFLEDYKVLSKQLTTIADKISHDVMVPFGPKAFLPGKLRHTNEGSHFKTLFHLFCST